MTAHPTTTAGDLYAAILREPWDDVPRLLYADEIDGYEPERADYIRLAIRCPHSEFVHLTGGNYASGPFALLGMTDRKWSWGEGEVGLVLIDEGDGTRYRVSRGFISSVSLTLAQFWGGACERCSGSGTTTWNDLPKCRPCSGTGRIPGLVESLASRWPVTEIRLVDREPQRYVSDTNWHWNTRRAADSTEMTTLPDELIGKLKGHVGGYTAFRMYRGRESALAALSCACVDLSRERAGLPAMKWKQ